MSGGYSTYVDDPNERGDYLPAPEGPTQEEIDATWKREATVTCKCGELTHPPARTTTTRCDKCKRVLVTPLLHLELGLPERCPVCDPEPKGG